MFLKPTVFILGAGASYHYGYPTGEDLVKNVKKKAEQFEKHLQKKIKDGFSYSDTPSFIFGANNYNIIYETEQKIQEYISQCQSLKKKLDQIDPPVIDHFLSKNQTLDELGKFLIAWEMLECEIKENAIEGNWYRFLIQHMMSDCHTPDDFLKNNVHFITFNYDVSLEKRLYRGLEENHFFDGKTVLKDFFTENRIRHVYGKIRKNPYTTTPTQYSQNDTMNFKKLFDDAHTASLSIQTMSPKDKDEISAELIENAENIYILGYGFDAMNNKNIGLEESLFFDSFAKKHRERGIETSLYFTNFDQKNVISKRASNLGFKTAERFLAPNPPIVNKNERGHKLGYHYEMSTKNVYKALSEDFDLL